MHLDLIHREGTGYHPPGHYRSLANRCKEELLGIPGARFVVICGSLPKEDLIPGWSDLDLLVFFGSDSEKPSVLLEMGKAISRAKESIGFAIGVGADPVFMDEFRQTYRFGGRPLMMTYEVAEYGEFYPDESVLEGLPPVKEIRERLEADRRARIQSVLHRWRRYVLQNPSELSTNQDAKVTIKVGLRLLQLHTGPNRKAPITYDGAMDRFRRRESEGWMEDTLESAVQLRNDWPRLSNDIQRFGKQIASMKQSMARWPIHGVR